MKSKSSKIFLLHISDSDIDFSLSEKVTLNNSFQNEMKVVKNQKISNFLLVIRFFLKHLSLYNCIHRINITCSKGSIYAFI